jgi:neutral trehalase
VENKELAYANAIAITHEKTESGFIPNFGANDDGKSRDRSQPPVGSLAVREIYRIYREEWFVRYLFDDLLTWNRWFAANRRLENGQLCWGSNPYEPKNGVHWETNNVNNRTGAALESGLDNSPMYDGMSFNGETHLMELADVGLTGLYIMDCEALAELADVLERPEAGELWERAALSKKGLEELWDEEFGMYLNKRTDTGEYSRRISPTNFYALFSNTVSPQRVERIINGHFYNPEEFYGEFIMPTIARNDPAYQEQNYWRGCIWAPTNYLAYLAIRRHRHVNCAALACKDFAEKSKNLILKEWTLNGHVHENYHGDTGMGCTLPHSDRFYHWGGLLTLIALTESGYVQGPEKAL